MYSKKDVLLNLTNGTKVHCVSVRKNNTTIVVPEDAYARARNELKDAAINDPESVKGNVFAYLKSSDKMAMKTDMLVSYDIYQKEMSKPSNKKLDTEIKRLTAEREKLAEAMAAVNHQIIAASKSLLDVVKSIKDQTVPK